MSEPSLALQRAIVARLKADPALSAIVDGRVYDAPAAGAAHPYVTLGDDQVIGERGDGYDAETVTLTIHVWSRATGFPEAKNAAGAIRAALGPGLVLEAGRRLVDLAFEAARFLREPDGKTSHAVLTFTALTEPD